MPEAIRKATEAAKRSLIRVPLREGRTLHHDIAGHHGAGKVVLRPAPPGTGIIAGGPMRAVFETLGVQRRGRQVARHAPIPTTWCAPPSMRCKQQEARAWSRHGAARR